MASETSTDTAVQTAPDAAGTTAPGAGEGERRSRYEETVRELKNSNKTLSEQLAEMRGQVGALLTTLQAQQRPQSPSWTDIDDPEERRDASLAAAHGEIENLKRTLKEREAEAAHNAMVDRSLKGLSFGDGEGADEDAREVVDAYARKGKSAAEVRAFAERMASRMGKPNNNQTPEPPAVPDAKVKEQEWAR